MIRHDDINAAIMIRRIFYHLPTHTEMFWLDRFVSALIGSNDDRTREVKTRERRRRSLQKNGKEVRSPP